MMPQLFLRETPSSLCSQVVLINQRTSIVVYGPYSRLHPHVGPPQLPPPRRMHVGHWARSERCHSILPLAPLDHVPMFFPSRCPLLLILLEVLEDEKLQLERRLDVCYLGPLDFAQWQIIAILQPLRIFKVLLFSKY